MRRPAGPASALSYEGQVLIAMPSLREGIFARSVVYMCAHREDGAMGIIINHRASEIEFPKLLAQLKIVPESEAIRLPPSVEEIPDAPVKPPFWIVPPASVTPPTMETFESPPRSSVAPVSTVIPLVIPNAPEAPACSVPAATVVGPE